MQESLRVRSNRHPRTIYLKFNKSLKEAITGVYLNFCALKPEVNEVDLKVSLEIHAGSSPKDEDMKALCTYAINWQEKDNCQFYTIPACRTKWLRFKIVYDATAIVTPGLIELSELLFFQEDESNPLYVRNLLKTYDETASWSHETWIHSHRLDMDQNEALDWENFCLPTAFPAKPVIFSKEKVTVSFGDVQCDDLP